MRDLVTLAAAFATLGLIGAIHLRHLRVRGRGSALSEMVEMVLVALLVGIFPLALCAALLGLWTALAGGLTAADLVTVGIDFVSLALIAVTAVAFRRLVRVEGNAVRAR